MSDKPFCPNCDSGRIFRRNNKPAGKEDNFSWGCRACQTSFNNPRYREPHTKANHAGNKGLAKQLADADPDSI